MNTLKAENRDKKTTKAKALRRAGFIPGNIFGKEMETPVTVKMSEKDVNELLRSCTKGSQVKLDVEGTSYDTLIKQIDYDAVKHQVLDIEFQALVSDEEVHSVAEVVIVNRDKLTNGILEEMLEEISYRALPADLVEKVIVDVNGMKEGESICVKDLDIAKNEKIHLITASETVIVELVPEKKAPVEETEE